MRKTNLLVTYDVHARLFGKKFNPSDLVKISGLQLSYIIEPGKIARSGKNKGGFYDYGSASMITPAAMDDASYEDKLEWIISKLEGNKKHLAHSHIDSLTINLNIGYKDQCSMALDPLILKRIYDLNADFSFDVYKYEDAGIVYDEYPGRIQVAELQKEEYLISNHSVLKSVEKKITLN